MGGFATLQALKDHLALAQNDCSCVFRRVQSTPVTSIWHSYWRGGSGYPPVGALPAAGLGSAVALDKNSTGALDIGMVGSGEELILLGMEMQRAVANQEGVMLLVDRLAHFSVALNQADGAVSPALSGTARLAAGEGAMLIAEVHTALSAGANVFAFGYTNEAGTAGRTTQQVTSIASAIADRVPYDRGLFIPLQSGDRGVRSVESWDLVSGTATGTLTIALVKPIAWLPIGGMSQAHITARDFILQMAILPKIHESACLSMYINFASTTTASTFGRLRFTSR